MRRREVKSGGSFAAALALTAASSWMVPAAIFLSMRAGMLAGVFVPLAVQLALGFGWSAVPFWPACPPVATIMLPTSWAVAAAHGYQNLEDAQGSAAGAQAAVMLPIDLYAHNAHTP